MKKNNPSLNTEIDRFITAYDGTAIGCSIKNMYENGSSYESICDKLGIDYEDYEDFEEQI